MTIDLAREILAELAPEIDADEITETANLDELGLDRVTRFALGVGLERGLKIEIPDERIITAATIGEMVGDQPTL